jgi:preprotein translocase subunit SecF
MAKLKRLMEINAKILVRLCFLVPIWIIWSFVGERYEPFRSHFWLTFLCETLSTVAVVIAAFLVLWHRKKSKLRGDNEPS